MTMRRSAMAAAMLLAGSAWPYYTMAADVSTTFSPQVLNGQNYAVIEASTGAVRATPRPIVFSADWGRRYFSDAAVLKLRPEDIAKLGAQEPTIAMDLGSTGAKGINPNLNTPDFAIGPPSRMMNPLSMSWDHLAFRVKLGMERKVFEYFNFDDRCAAVKGTLTVASAPHHGKLIIQDGPFEQPELIKLELAKSLNGQPDPRLACTATVDGSAVRYIPDNVPFDRDEAIVLIKDRGYLSLEIFEFFPTK